jgi:hypothetical protein
VLGPSSPSGFERKRQREQGIAQASYVLVMRQRITIVAAGEKVKGANFG